MASLSRAIQLNTARLAAPTRTRMFSISARSLAANPAVLSAINAISVTSAPDSPAAPSEAQLNLLRHFAENGAALSPEVLTPELKRWELQKIIDGLADTQSVPATENMWKRARWFVAKGAVPEIPLKEKMSFGEMRAWLDSAMKKAATHRREIQLTPEEAAGPATERQLKRVAFLQSLGGSAPTFSDSPTKGEVSEYLRATTTELLQAGKREALSPLEDERDQKASVTAIARARTMGIRLPFGATKGQVADAVQAEKRRREAVWREKTGQTAA